MKVSSYIRTIISALVTGTLCSCIVFPSSKGTHEFAHEGMLYGKSIAGDVSDKQKVIEVQHYTATDIKYLFSPEGPIRKSLGPATITYNYFLEINGHRIPLAGMDAYSAEEKWDQFFFLGEQWYALNHHIKPRHVRLAIFSKNSLPVFREFDLNSGNTTVQLYLHKDRKTLFWKTKYTSAYHYQPGKDQAPIELSAENYSKAQRAAIKLVKIESLYDDIDFQTEKNEIIGKDPNNATGIKHKIESAFATKSEKSLNKYSKSYHYIIRWAVAENPAAPTDILQRLSYDESEYVANAAKRQLKQRGIISDSQSEDYY